MKRKILILSLLINAAFAFTQEAPIRVMTFNVRFDNPADGINSWENRRKLVTLSLRNDSPDLIGMQEVLVSQLEYLANNLPGYGFIGVGRDDGRIKGEYTPILYKSDRFDLLDQASFWLSPTPADTGSVGWDAALTRICTWAHFKEKASGFEFYFLNTHFDHMGQVARTESARLILQFIATNTSNLPVILTGDFNCSPEEEPYRVFSGDNASLIDACTVAHGNKNCDEGTFNGFGSEKDPQRIDMIFYKGDWQISSYEVKKIKYGDVFISDHWPVVAVVDGQRTAVGSQRSAVSSQRSRQGGISASLRSAVGVWELENVNVVQTFTFDSIVTRRALFQFPDRSKKYEKILMLYTLKCDSLTPHDKYPCGEWDYTTYTRVYKHTGVMDSVKNAQPGFVVKGKSPKSYLYSETPTYTYFFKEEWNDDKTGQENREEDIYARFEGADYIEVPGEAFSEVRDELTVSFWLNGDPFHQPMASSIFEGLDDDGKRVVNLHVPYDNGVVYWDAGGHGEGLTDNIYQAANPRDYKGRWTHWAVTKNSVTGEQKIYLNGKLFRKGTDLKRTMDGISTFRIGSNGNGTGKFYQGSLDDFAAWNRELDSLDIESLFLKSVEDYPRENMLFAYDFDKLSGFPLIPDQSGNAFNGKSFGNPSFIAFGRLPYPDWKNHSDGKTVMDSIPNPVVSIILYSDSLNPATPSDTLEAWPGYRYFCNSQGIVIDSSAVPGAKELLRKTRFWYGEPFEIIEPYEIGRFITPYGKRLDLGLNGFTWVYDVTDYEPLLHGMVDLQAANGQELLDLKFAFIEGIPPRDVLSVRNIWPEGSYKYEDLADDEALQATSLRLQDDASTFKVRARISGHGHNGPFNCCEWDPKIHTYTINDDKKFDWKIWRDCGMNPVYPQGGTWQFDRAGWCPGTFVDTYDFEITPYVESGNIVTIDYGIQPYDLDNGEEGGNFEMAMQLFEYSAPNYRLDLELTDILAPSTRQEYRRMNPISINPVVRVRNNGTDTIFSFNIMYGLLNVTATEFEWTGKLGFMESADIILPKPSWEGMSQSSQFAVSINLVNGMQDERESNNDMLTAIEAPVILPGKFIVHVKTQGFGRAADNAYTITDANGKIVKERQVFEDDSTYHDVIKLKPGAYHFNFTDKNEDGMIRHWWLYWEDPDKVGENGELKILDMDGNEIMNLGYDFAEKRTIQFFVSDPQ